MRALVALVIAVAAGVAIAVAVGGHGSKTAGPTATTAVHTTTPTTTTAAPTTTTTPVADPDRRYVYAASSNGLIHKLSVASGREARGRWPVKVTKDSTHEKLASALNLSGRYVLAATGGYIGDAPPYQGHVLSISRSSGRIAGVFNSLCADRHQIIQPSTCKSSELGHLGPCGRRGDAEEQAHTGDHRQRPL